MTLETLLLEFVSGEHSLARRQLLRSDDEGLIMGPDGGQTMRIPLDLGAVARSPIGMAQRARSATASLVEELSTDNGTSCPAVVVAPTLACVVGLSPVNAMTIDSIVIGMEVSFRIADWLSLRSTPGWWDSALTAGGIGAVLACSRVWGLSPRTTISALGLVAAQVSTFHTDRSPPIRLMLAARTSSTVVEALFAARQGIDGPPDPLSGNSGLLSNLVGESDPKEIVAGLGDDWRSSLILHSALSCPWTDCTCRGGGDD